jgi:hypothetical protein
MLYRGVALPFFGGGFIWHHAFLLDWTTTPVVKRSRIRLDPSILDRDIDVAYLIAAATILRGGSRDLIERLVTGRFEQVQSAVEEAVQIVEFEACLPAKRFTELTEDTLKAGFG